MRILRLLAALAVLACAGAAWASVAIALSVEEMTARAELVVRGHVTGQQSAWTRGGRIVTTVHLAVDEALKGSSPAAIDVRHAGGHVGELAQQVTGEVGFTDGEEVVVFLRRVPAGFHVVGMSQGKFSIDRGHVAPVAAQKLDGLGLKRAETGAIEDSPGLSLSLQELQQRIARAAKP